MKTLLTSIVLAGSLTCPLCAQSIPEPQPYQRSSSQQGVKITSDVFVVALPVAAAGAAIIQQDWTGLKQLAFTQATTVGASLILKWAVHKQRPDHTDFNSFPSGHSSISFASAAFIQRRYGWKFGAPAYAVATYVGWARIYAKKHDIWDVLAGAAIGAGSAYIYTRPFARRHNLSLTPITDGTSFTVCCCMTF